MIAPLIDLDRVREERIAASRPPRRFNEMKVVDGLVCVVLPARMTPEQAIMWAEQLRYLAESAKRGEEADG